MRGSCGGPKGVGRPVRFLGKKEIFDAPVVGQIARAIGDGTSEVLIPRIDTFEDERCQKKFERAAHCEAFIGAIA